MKSCLPHQTEKSYCFQGDGLTSRVGACDDQQVEIFSQTDVDRHHFCLRNQRMASFADIYGMIRVKDRLRNVHVHGKRSLGKNKIKFCHNTLVLADDNGVLCGRYAEGGKDDFDFLLLLQLQLTKLIV